MTDVVDDRNPMGPVGSLVDRLLLRRDMTGLMGTRNAFLKQAAEAH